MVIKSIFQAVHSEGSNHKYESGVNERETVICAGKEFGVCEIPVKIDWFVIYSTYLLHEYSLDY